MVIVMMLFVVIDEHILEIEVSQFQISELLT